MSNLKPGRLNSGASRKKQIGSEARLRREIKMPRKTRIGKTVRTQVVSVPVLIIIPD